MDAVRLGSVCRALRIKKGWRQADLAARAGVSRTTISDLETGHVRRLRVEVVLRIVETLGGRVDFVVRWQGGDLDRLLNARHAALHTAVASMFRSLSEWEIAPEVSFSIRGERGIIDVLAWHSRTRTLLVIELKTEIVDINEMLGTLDRKTRLARTIARERGWFAETVAVWLVVADSSMNRRRVAAHASVLSAALPTKGTSVPAWLRLPRDSVRALSFWANSAGPGTIRHLATRKRVRQRKSTDLVV